MNINYFFAIIVLMISVLFLFKIRLNKSKECSLNRDTTNVLKGYSIVLIIIHHMVVRMPNPGVLLPFRITGYLGVSIFFFLSGYGLMCSADGREKTYSSGFMLKRIQRVYIPALCAQIFYMLVLMIFFNENYSLMDFIKGAATLYPIDTSQWYIIAIFFWYICFWLLIKFFTSWNKVSVSLFICSIIYILVCLICFKFKLNKYWIDTSFCFPFGVAFAAYRVKLLKIINKNTIILPISLILFIVTVLFSFGKDSYFAVALRMVSSITFIVCILMILRLFDVSNNKIISFIGTISLECYLIHGKVIRIVKMIFNDIGVFEIIIYFVSTIILVTAFVLIMKGYKALLTKKHIFVKSKI